MSWKQWANFSAGCSQYPQPVPNLSQNPFRLFRKCFRDPYNYLDDLPAIPPTEKVDWDISADDGMKTTIPIHQFTKHVMELHADGDIGFSKEYEAIQAMAIKEEFASEISQHPDNKQKNRYLNIIACTFELFF